MKVLASFIFLKVFTDIKLLKRVSLWIVLPKISIIETRYRKNISNYTFHPSPDLHLNIMVPFFSTKFVVFPKTKRTLFFSHRVTLVDLKHRASELRNYHYYYHLLKMILMFGRDALKRVKRMNNITKKLLLRVTSCISFHHPLCCFNAILTKSIKKIKYLIELDFLESPF